MKNEQLELKQVEQSSSFEVVTLNVKTYQGNNDAIKALDEICELILLKILWGFISKTDRKSINKSSFCADVAILMKFERFIIEVLDHLESTNYLLNEDGELIFSEEKRTALETFHFEESMNDFKKMFPDFQAHANLIVESLQKLSEILSGDVKATEVLFPNGDMSLVSAIYKGNYVADYFNELLCSYVTELVKNSSQEKIKILEIGAGTGGTSKLIFKELKPFSERIEYVYTDISQSFLNYAEKEYRSENPYLQTKLLNIEENPLNQDFQEGSFDLIIAANVLHATKNIEITLENTKRLLKNQGVVLLNEISKTELFNTLTFGLLDGWWIYEDAEIRLKGSPGLSSDSWDLVLNETGFKEIEILPNDGNLSQQIVVAKSDGWIKVETLKQLVVQEVNKPLSQKIEGDMQLFVAQKVADVLKMQPEQIDPNTPITDYGIDSIVSLDLIKEINNVLNASIPTTVLFDYPTVGLLSEYLSEEFSQRIKEKTSGISQEMSSPQKNEAVINVAVSEQEEIIHLEKGKSVKLWLNKPGEIDDIEFKLFDIPALKDTEVLVEIHSFSLNFGDLLCVKGMYPTMPDYPFSPGFEASGVVLQAGSKIKNVKEGDEVVVLANATHSTHIVVTEDHLFVKPTSLSHIDACSLPVVAITMLEVFKRIQLKAGETILIQTATGGAGLIGVQLAKHIGARIIATAGSAQKLNYLREIGVDEVINYLEDDFAVEVNRLTNNQGVDVVINTLSGANVQKGMNCLSRRGRYVELSMTAIKSASNMDLRNFANNQTFFGVDLRKMFEEEAEYTQQLWKECIALVEQGVIKNTTQKVVNFSNAKDAYRTIENRGNIGKVVVEVIPDDQRTAAQKEVSTGNFSNCDIAIVGMSGAFGRSKSIEEFWQYIREGKSLIEEVPSERWNLEEHYSEDKTQKDKTYSKWGSFLQDIDQFDPSFFRISGREAEVMDPQQRLFLQHCWHAIEDSGIHPDSLNDLKCNVYVGAQQGDYIHAAEEPNQEPAAFWGNSASVLASRISYLLNLKGAAVAIDSACSSSLVAIDMACKSLRSGESNLGLAGGVSLFVTPYFFKQASNAGMLSANGTCYAFDHRANGFVPGEGVGVIVLKRLDDALRDNDNIHALIKGSAVNQDGLTSGITAPSMRSQFNLEKEVYSNYNIHPETISYVETHGTGTSLGDPIEFDALKRSFEAFTEKKNFCSLGSVKTNVGHTIMSAGVAGIVKVVMSLKNKELPPSLNFEAINPLINLEMSPFKIQTQLEEWRVEGTQKRRAAVSSFGFSGTNAHVVLEEFDQQKTQLVSNNTIIVLSAKNKEQLQDYARQLLSFIQQPTFSGLSDLAYTLQVGRKHFEERLAYVVTSTDQLIDCLEKYLSNDYTNGYFGNTEANGNTFVLQGEAGKAYITTATKEKEIGSLGQLWVNGINVDWNLLYGSNKPHKISAPVYPFAKESYWLTSAIASKKGSKSYIHPLVHENVSNVFEQRYTSTFDGSEYFFDQHRVKSEKILPAVAYIEMIREAASKYLSNEVSLFSDFNWLVPIKISHEVNQISILFDLQDNQMAFQVVGGEVSHSKHSQGTIQFESPDQPHPINLSSLRDRFETMTKGADFYQQFEDTGLQLGNDFKGIKKVYHKEGEALSEIELTIKGEYYLTPGILDSALQTTFALQLNNDSKQMALPYMVKQIAIFDRLPSKIWSYVRLSENNRKENRIHSYDVDIFNEEGTVLLQMKEFVFLPLDQTQKAETSLASISFQQLEWESKAAQVDAPKIAGEVVLLGGSSQLAENLLESTGLSITALQPASEINCFEEVFECVQSKMREREAHQLLILYPIQMC